MKFGIFSVVDHYPAELERTQAQFTEELLEQGQLAEELGFDSFWIAEHHFHEYGMIPRPAIFLAALAARTKRIRLGSAVAVLPFDNPLRIAEDFAMLDVISGGRLEFGVGSGYLQHEYAGFNLSADERRERFDESLAIIRRAWSGEKFSFDGKYNQIKDVALNMIPQQKPEPPIHIAVLRNEVAQFVGQQRLGMMMIPYATTDAMSQLKDTCDAYNNAFERVAVDNPAKSAGTPTIKFGLHTYCSEDTDTARAFAKPYMDRYVRTRLYAKQRTNQELIEKNLIAMGDPHEIERIARLYEECGLTDFLMIMNFGGLPHENVVASMKLTAKEVLSKF